MQCAHYLISRQLDNHVYMSTRDWIYLTVWDYNSLGATGSGYIRCEMWKENRHPNWQPHWGLEGIST